MRLKLIKFILVLSVFATVVGCEDESTYYVDAETEDTKEGDDLLEGDYGYLNISKLTLSVDTSAEEFVDAETKSVTTKAESDDYTITIESNNLVVPVVLEMNYADFLAEADQGNGYPLEPGDYTVTIETEKIDSEGDVETIVVGDNGADLGEARYKGVESFVIKKGATTNVGDIICTLCNVKTSVTLSADLKALFKPDAECTGDDVPLTVTVTMGNRTYSFSRYDADKLVFFDPISEKGNSMEIVLSGMYNTASADLEPSYAKIEGWKQTIDDVEQGQWRKISINVLHANEGNIEFEVTVENWVYDAIIDVDITKMYALSEEIIIDPELLPKMELVGSTDNKVFVSTEEGIEVDPVTFYFTPRAGATLTSIVVSEQTILGSEPLTIWPIPDVNLYSDLFTVTESSSNNVVSVVATDEGMDLLKTMPDGVSGILYSPTIDVVDSRNYSSSQTYDITVGEATVPSIVWTDHDFATRYEITAGVPFEVVIDITSDTGISGFLVDIDSEVLTEDELASVNLAQHMDLVNPGDLEAGLSALGFPVGNEILGQTSLVFDISDFIPILAGLGTGDSDFVLTITNSAGGTSSVTVKFRAI